MVKLNKPIFIFYLMYDLSPALLNLYQDCARCFWVEIHENVKRPSGSTKTLPSGMNLAFKKYADSYRSKGTLPPELQRQIDGVFLPDQKLIDTWRDMHKGFTFQDKELGVVLRGVLDECIVKSEDGKQLYVPLDFKTRGFENSEENHDTHAQLKLDCYELLLQENKYMTSSTGYLVYYVPEEVEENGVVKFNVQVIQLVTDGKRIMNLLEEVVHVLEGKMPKAGGDCEYCAWGDLGASMKRSTV